jgi:electron transfer flavoprotein alpha subunit
MRVAVLVKQVPRAEEMELLPDGRLKREGVELEMNAYCRRAVSKGVEIARDSGGTCTVFTLGPPVAEDTLREAVAWGADDGVLVTDAAFAGSDTLATASTLAAALRRDGPFDLVLVGRNSIDADTGQVGPEVAELLDLPFAGGIKELTLSAQGAEARCELDDGWRAVRVELPAVLSTAERLTEPCKVDPEGRAAVDVTKIRRLNAADLGAGPWGAAGSPTVVGAVRTLDVARHRVVLSGDIAGQVAEAVGLLGQWGALDAVRHHHAVDSSGAEADGSAEPAVDAVPPPDPAALAAAAAPVVAVVIEPDRPRVARELLGEAVHIARSVAGTVVAIGPGLPDPVELASWGADRVVAVEDTSVEEDVALALTRWCEKTPPWAVLVPGTLWGRVVAARTAARLGAGLTGDAVGFGVEDGRLVTWKPAFGGSLVAAITCRSEVQMATVRPGVLSLRAPRPVAGAQPPPLDRVTGATRGRVQVVDAGRDDEVEALLAARTVVGVGMGVAPDEYGDLGPLLKVLGAELGASRKVTDKGWLPRARQIGITGHSVAPALYVAVGVSGKFNHIVGARGAGTIVVINNDPEAKILDWADVAIVGDWHDVVPLLVDALG